MSSDAIQFLLRLSDRLKVGLRLEAAMVAISDATLELLGGDHASVRLLDSTGERLLCGARSGVGLQNQPFVFRLGEGAIGWAVANCQVVHIRDTAADQRFTPAEDQGFSIRSLLALPLWSEGRVVGVLGCSSKAVGAFSKEQETLGCLLANCVSPYIEKARMERLMITDPHTMAFNERYFFPRLKEEFERVRRNETRLSLLLMDLDLGQVRSQRGHGIHDRLLQCFVDRVRTSVRLSDTFFRRGEAFALIMPDLAPGTGQHRRRPDTPQHDGVPPGARRSTAPGVPLGGHRLLERTGDGGGAGGAGRRCPGGGQAARAMPDHPCPLLHGVSRGQEILSPGELRGVAGGDPARERTGLLPLQP